MLPAAAAGRFVPADVPTGHLASISSVELTAGGLRTVTVQVHIGKGPADFRIVGSDERAIEHSRDTLRAAFVSSGLGWPEQPITISVDPPDDRAALDHALDVAIVAGILAGTGRLDPAGHGKDFDVGALALDGTVRAPSGGNHGQWVHLIGGSLAPIEHLRQLADPSIIATAPTAPIISPAHHIVAQWQRPPATADPSTGLGGIP